MIAVEMAERLIERITDAFEARFGIQLTQLERDCLLRDCQAEADEVVDIAFEEGWQECDHFHFGEENDDEAAAFQVAALLRSSQRQTNGNAG